MARAAVFPGQGTQVVGMGRDLVERFPRAAELFAEADATLGFPLSKVCFEGPADRLDQTDVQQPAVFVVSVALFRAAESVGRFGSTDFAAMGGLSLGEYTALHLAGAVSFSDAVRLLYRRGQLMQEASDRIPSGMVSLIGLDEPKVLAACEQIRATGRIWPANYNCPGQIVVSGEKTACEAIVAAADQFGCRAVPLKVAGAFHSEIMRHAADGLRPLLAECRFERPRVRVISNVDASYHEDPDRIREWLYRQTFNPVRWQACVERMIADGCTEFSEVGPGRTLTAMMRKINRQAATTNLSAAGDIQPAAA